MLRRSRGEGQTKIRNATPSRCKSGKPLWAMQEFCLYFSKQLLYVAYNNYKLQRHSHTLPCDSSNTCSCRFCLLTTSQVEVWPKQTELHLECGMRHQSTSSSIRVLVSDDTRVHTELLADALRRDGSLQVTTSPTGTGLTTRPDLNDVDVLLLSSTLDEHVGRGFEILRELHSSHGYVPAVMLLDSSKSEAILEAFRSGARGILGRHESVEIFNKCLRRVHEGQIWANSEQMSLLVHALASSHTVCAVDARGMNLLSKREMEIVRSVAQGLTNREIAERLDLSSHTIKNSLFRIFDKLGVSNRVELLLMTMSRDRDAQSGLQYLLENHADVTLQDEATLLACQRAAEQGVLMAQLVLAQFYSDNKTNPDNVLQTYAWYSIACEKVSQAWKDVTRTMTVDQVLQAEEMAAKWLDRREKSSSIRPGRGAQRRQSTRGEEVLERAVG
jgi:DNA-binding NarL/FixJ family response regulator